MTRLAMMRLAVALLVAVTAACRRLPPPTQMPGERDPAGATDSADTRDAGTERSDPGESRGELSPRAAAIIDSIEAAVRDSFATLRDSVAAAERARRDSIALAESLAQARQDSIARVEAARQDSIDAAIEAARRDSVAAADAARRDSIARAEQARQDSLTAAARLDSLATAEAALADSLAAAIEQARRDSIAAAMAAAATDVDRLRELGPSYIPYDEGPTVIWDTETQAQLSVALMPVLREHSLPARTKTTFWVLITREGDVTEIVLQTGSGNEAFDAAAEAFARTLTFIPAIRANRPVPAWVLREISMLMRED